MAKSSGVRGGWFLLLVPLGVYVLFMCWESYKRSTFMLLDANSNWIRNLAGSACKSVFVESHDDSLIFLLDGHPIDGAPSAKGINVVTIDPRKQSVLAAKTYDSGTGNQELASDLGSLASGIVFLIGVKDVGRKLDASVLKVLQGLGSTLAKGATPKGYALIGSIGGTALAESQGKSAQAFAVLPCSGERRGFPMRQQVLEHNDVQQATAEIKDAHPDKIAEDAAQVEVAGEDGGEGLGLGSASGASAGEPDNLQGKNKAPSGEQGEPKASIKEKQTDASKGTETKPKSKPRDENESPETTYHCVGGSGDRSCLFKNLYYHHGRFAMFVLKGPNKPIEVQRADKYEGLWKPDVEVFSSVQKIAKRVKDGALIEEPGLSVQFNPLFHNNIGHAIFDGLYPAFFATVKLKVQDVPWRPVVAVDPGCFEEGASGSLKAGDLVEAYLPHPKYGRTLRAVRVRIVSAPTKSEKTPECKWKSGMDHNGLDLGSDQVGQGQKSACMKGCALSFGCKAGVLYEGTCYLKGAGGGAFHRTDRPGIAMCLMEGEGPKANIVVKPEPKNIDDDTKQVTIPDAWVVGKVRRRCMSEGIYETFGMTGEMRRLFELERDCRNYPNLLIRFEEIAFGVGGAGNMIADRSGAIGGSLPPHNAMSQFRDRMLRAYNLPVDRGVKPVPPDKDLNIMVVSNKRFNVRGEDRRLLNDVISKLNRKGGIKAEMIDWGAIGNPSIEGASPGSKFREHLKRTQKADVYVSSIGTALQYVPFMRDGKIYIALGSVWMRSGQYFPTFMEQQLAGGGTPFLRTLYADPGGVLRSGKNYPRLGEDGYFAGINGTLVYDLMLQSEGLLRKGFEIPVDPKENLSVEGQVLVELCKRDRAACDNIINNRNGGHGMQLLWNECVVYEVGPWRKGGPCGSSHHKLLREIKKEYGINGLYGAPER